MKVLPRCVRGFLAFRFSLCGGCRGGFTRKTNKEKSMKKSKQGAPDSARLSGSVGTGPAEVMNNRPGVMNIPPRARTRVVGLGSSPTEILKESLLDLPRARTRGRSKPQGDFAAWRVKTFGGDFDPVRVAVDEAVAEFSVRDPARDRELWLKVANEIGCEAFRELYLTQKSILDDCRRRGNPLRAPAAAFQARLNRYTGHGKQEGGAR